MHISHTKETAKKRTALILITALIITCFSSAAAFAGEQEAAAVNYDAVSAAAQQQADTLVKGYGETSVQYALISDGKIILSGNAGVFSKNGNTKLTADTMYGVGSISKMFTTAAIMKLVDMGQVKLDTPVTAYLPEFKMADERYKKITVRMLLNHSSGLMGSTFQNAFLMGDNDSYAKDHLLENLKEQRLKADPGAYSVYCNDGFTLAELIVDKLCRPGYPEFIKKYFTSQLGMERTETPADSFDRKQLAATYFPGIEAPTPADSINVIGAGGVYSTAEDMCRFARLFMKDGAYSDVLSEQSAEATMQKEYRKGMWPAEHDNLIGYGLGWDSVDAFPMNRYGIQALVKGGDTLLYHSSLVVLPQYDMAMAVLSSSGSSVYNQTFAMSVLQETLEAQGKITKKADLTFTAPAKAAMPSDQMNYAGIYANSTVLMKAEITKDGQLSITLPANPNYPARNLIYSPEGDFKNSDGSTAISFVKEKNGKTYMMSSGYSSLPGLGQLATREYSAEKIDPVALSDAVKTAWAARDGKFYYIINEKYTSQIYAVSLPLAGVGFVADAPGYLAANKIADENNAFAFVQLPGIAGRDLRDYSFFTKDGKEYMKCESTLLISGDSVSEIYAEGNAVCTIPEDGYARWFRIHSSDAGKTLKIDLPGRGAFAVYDKNNNCVQYSLIDGKNTVNLPDGGMIVFAGDKGVQFKISRQ